jgi:hypothetical protein
MSHAILASIAFDGITIFKDFFCQGKTAIAFSVLTHLA